MSSGKGGGAGLGLGRQKEEEAGYGYHNVRRVMDMECLAPDYRAKFESQVAFLPALVQLLQLLHRKCTL